MLRISQWAEPAEHPILVDCFAQRFVCRCGAPLAPLPVGFDLSAWARAAEELRHAVERAEEAFRHPLPKLSPPGTGRVA